jgi:hypothetical protein
MIAGEDAPFLLRRHLAITSSGVLCALAVALALPTFAEKVQSAVGRPCPQDPDCLAARRVLQNMCAAHNLPLSRSVHPIPPRVQVVNHARLFAGLLSV